MPSPVPPWPVVTPLAGRPHALLGGEVTLHAPPTGRLWQVGFSARYELVLREEGVLRRGAEHVGCAPVLLWAHLRCASLYAALGGELDLLVTQGPPGHAGQPVTPWDVWDRARHALLDQGGAREVMSRAHQVGPVVSLLGDVRSMAELTTRAVAAGAPGTLVELRRQENGIVTVRTRLTLSALRGSGPTNQG